MLPIAAALKGNFNTFWERKTEKKGLKLRNVAARERMDKINKVPHFCRLNSSRLEKKAIRATNPLQLLGWLFSNKW